MGSRDDTGAVLTVGAGTDEEYDTIQAAADDAAAGDSVEVRPGIYHEQVELSNSVSLTAPEGAILDGQGLGERTKGTVHGLHIGEGTRGIVIGSGADVEPDVEGFYIRGYEIAVDADRTAGSWVLRNVTLERNGEDGISAIGAEGSWEVHGSILRMNLEEGIDGEGTTGPWTVSDTIIERNGDDGIDADGDDTSADWTIVGSTIRNNGDHGLELKHCVGSWTIRETAVVNNKSGVGAHHTRGDWNIERSNLSGNHFVGVRCPHADGDWSIRRTMIRDTSTAVWAPATTGDWVIEDSFLGDTYYVPNDNLGEGTVVFAPYTSGEWEITGCCVTDAKRFGIDASEADPEGDATGNWWGPGDAPVMECAGSVDVRDPLPERPDGERALVAVGASFETERANTRRSPFVRTLDECSTSELVDLLADRVEKLHPSGGS